MPDTISENEHGIVADLKGVVTVARAEKVAHALHEKGWRKIDQATADAIGNLEDCARNFGEGPVMLGSIETVADLLGTLTKE